MKRHDSGRFLAFRRAKRRRKIDSGQIAGIFEPQFLNPDDVCRAFLIERGFRGFGDAPAEIQKECSIEAANATFQEVETRLFRSGVVGMETVLSTGKYLPLARDAAQTHLIYIGNQSPEISIARVALRVRKGGHNVPEAKIRARWHRSLEFLPVFWTLSHQAWLFDNSDLPELIAQKQRGKTEFLAPIEGNVLLESLVEGGVQPE